MLYRPAAAAVLLLAAGAVCAQPAVFQGLGLYVSLGGVSADGGVVTAMYPAALGPFQGAIWRRGSGWSFVPPPAGYESSRFSGVSDDGVWMSGSLTQPGNVGSLAIRYSVTGGFEIFDDLVTGTTPPRASGTAISADGSTIAGYGRTREGRIDETRYPLRWRTSTPEIVGPVGTEGADISGDGDAVVITGFFQSSLWTPATTHTIPATGVFANTVSDDGLTVAGGVIPWRWDLTGGYESLPPLPGQTTGSIYASSADGSVLAGGAPNGGRGDAAFIWTRAYGTRSVREVLAANGILVGGWELWNVRDMSPDGRYMIGEGRNPSGAGEAWYAFIPSLEPSPCNWAAACVGDFDRSGGIDGDDIGAFFASWQAGDICSDVDRSGGTDGDDIAAFFDAWQSGC